MMHRFLFVFHPVGLLSFLFVVVVEAQNVAMSSSTGIAIGAMGRGRGGLLFQRSQDARQQEEDLPNGISSFEDVSIDIENDSLVFALSTVSRRVCSFIISDEDSLKFVNCVGNNNDDFRVSPFCGVSALGGTIIISGGTGGLTIYEYDTDSGEINESPSVLNLDLGVIGHPDVVLVDANLAALSTDFSGSPRFGTQVASIGGDNSVSFVRNFRVRDSLGFSSSLGPANFPLVNAVYTTTSDEDNSYMYTANGAIQVQDPRSANSITALSLSGAPNGFSAVTVAVNTEQKYVLFGGLIGGGNSAILIYDIFDDPRNPILMESILLSGQRITSIASAGDAISYTTTQGNDSDGIQFERLPIRDIDDTPNSSPSGLVTIPPNLCFSSENTVQTFDRGVISMKSLRIGDLVLVEGGKYARVYSFGHYDDKIIINNYLQIISTTNNKGDSDTTTSILELSADHMVYILRDDDSNKNIITIPASSIQVGDVLIDGNDAKVVVTKIVNKVNNRRGAYAPFTTTGNIVVSNILASNYISISSMLEKHPYFYPQQQQWIAHTFNTPHRILCSCSIELFCKNETYNTHGLSNWLVLPYTVVQWLAKQTTVIQFLIVVILVLPLLLFMSFLDKLFMLIASSSMSVFVVFMIGISLLLQRNNKQTTKLNNNNNMKFKIW